MTPFSFFLFHARWPSSFTLHFPATGKTFMIIISSHVWCLDSRFAVFCCRLCTSSMNSIRSSIVALSWVTFLQTCWNKPTQPVWLHLPVLHWSSVSVLTCICASEAPSSKQQHREVGCTSSEEKQGAKKATTAKWILWFHHKKQLYVALLSKCGFDKQI